MIHSEPLSTSRKRKRVEPKQEGLVHRDVRAKAGRRKIKGKAGRFAFILQAPTEIVLEIMSHLMPVDILNLSYADKELRAMLTAPENKFIWVAARKNVPGLPDCPVDFTEWGYARFLFVRICDMCGGRAHGLPEMAFFRVRLCKRCSNEHILHSLELRARIVPLFGRELDLLPGRSGLYFKPAAERLSKRIDTAATAIELKVYQTERAALMEKVNEHARMLHLWLLQRQEQAGRTFSTLRATRKATIRERLLALGHDPQDIDTKEFQRLRVVNQAVELSDGAWPKVLRELQEVLSNIKAERIRKECRECNLPELKALYQNYWTYLPDDFDKYTMPPVLDFLDLPSCQRLLEGSIPERELRSVFQSTLADINGDIKRFQTRLRSDLFQLWDSHQRAVGPVIDIGDSDANKNDFTKYRLLRRATTVFTCRLCSCGEQYHYDTLFSGSFHLETELINNAFPDLPLKWQDLRRRLEASTEPCEVMESIVKRAKLNPDTATVEDLDKLGYSFDQPNEDRATRKINWRELYQELIALRTWNSFYSHRSD